MSIRNELRSGRAGVTAVCVLGAVGYLTIGLVRHDAYLVIVAPVIMLGYCAFLLAFRNRSESVALLAGTKGDERQRQVQLRATALTGNVLVWAIIIGLFWSLAVNADAVSGALSAMAAIGGLSFAAGMVWFSRRA